MSHFYDFNVSELSNITYMKNLCQNPIIVERVPDQNALLCHGPPPADSQPIVISGLACI